MNTKKFKFQIEVEEVPYASNTVEEIYGEGSTYNSDFPEYSIAIDNVHMLFQDAITNISFLKMNFLSRNKIDDVENILDESNRMFWQFLCAKEEKYLEMQKSLKPFENAVRQ